MAAPGRVETSSKPTSRATPAVPSTRPMPVFRLIGWRPQTAPSRAPHIGAVAFSTDSTEALSVRAP